MVRDRISPEDFEDESNREIAKQVFQDISNKKGLVPAELVNFAEGELSNVFARLIQEDCNFDDNKKAARDMIEIMQIYRLGKRENEILEALSSSGDLTLENTEELKIELNAILIKKKNKQRDTF